MDRIYGTLVGERDVYNLFISSVFLCSMTQIYKASMEIANHYSLLIIAPH